MASLSFLKIRSVFNFVCNHYHKNKFLEKFQTYLCDKHSKNLIYCVCSLNNKFLLLSLYIVSFIGQYVLASEQANILATVPINN